jgi:hypothetical protein
MDLDPDPAIFVITFKANKKIIFKIFSAYYILSLKVHLHHFSKIKCKKEITNSRNQGFSCYFCLMIEGSGSIPLTNGSGSGSRRPKTYGSGFGTESAALVYRAGRLCIFHFTGWLVYVDTILDSCVHRGKPMRIRNVYPGSRIQQQKKGSWIKKNYQYILLSCQ